MLFLRPSIASLLVVATVSEAANLRQAQRKLQTQPGDYFSAMLDRVNKERAAEGLPALCTNKKLQEAAQRHSDDQAANSYMDHTGTDGTNIEDRITQAGFDWSAVAENVAAGQPDVNDVMDSWMASPGHRENILGDYTMFGTAYAYNADSTYQHYWTQDFGTGDTEECEGGSIASESDNMIATLIESSEAEDTQIETDAPTTNDFVAVSDPPVFKTTSKTHTESYATEESCSGSQETEAPCTDAPTEVAYPPTIEATMETPTEGKYVEGESASQDTPVVVVDPPELGTTIDTLTEASAASNSAETGTPVTEVPEEPPIVEVDPPEIGTPVPEKVYKTNNAPTTQVQANKEYPHHEQDCTPGW
ncbi:unnamed protein product [Phytophthora lilii]|uniref:Unnamed protein product n=1 Tax=Phytophthora lilii TaxID=2077276 RepID=A0A9W6WPL2_9STRA|nr:unnamed protein product [Phytophthora lilii]